MWFLGLRVQEMASTTRNGGNRTSGQDNFPVDGMPSRPSDWGKEESAVWTKLMSQIPAELLRSNDAYQLKILCELIVREARLAKLLRDDATDLPTNRAHLQVAQQISRLSAMYGLSPIDRRRIRLQPQEPTDDGDDWANG
jgi:phage terminase small subunit